MDSPDARRTGNVSEGYCPHKLFQAFHSFADIVNSVTPVGEPSSRSGRKLWHRVPVGLGPISLRTGPHVKFLNHVELYSQIHEHRSHVREDP